MNKKYLSNIISFKENSNEKLFERADAHYDRGEYEAAFLLFLKAAENGEPSCMLNLGSMYAAGEGTTLNFDKALEWEFKALRAGIDRAKHNLGITYRMKGDIINSKKWFEKAFKSGDGSAALELAKLYSVSKKETETAKFYLRKALESDDLFEDDIELANKLLSEL